MADLDYKELQQVLEHIKNIEGTPSSPARIATELGLGNAEGYLAHLRDVDCLLAELGGSRGVTFYSLTSDGKEFLRQGGYNNWLNRRRRGLRTWWGTAKRTKGTVQTLAAVAVAICASVTLIITFNGAPDIVSAPLKLFHQPLPEYPPAQSVQVVLHRPNAALIPLIFADVNDEKPIEFPATDQSTKWRVTVHSDYWKGAVDSLTLSTPLRLELVPNGRLEWIKGRVVDDEKRGIEGIVVEFVGLDTSVTTNSGGSFSLQLPLEKQRKYVDVRMPMCGPRARHRLYPNKPAEDIPCQQQ